MRNKSKGKINYWMLILIILLAIFLVFSRARRSSKRAFLRSQVVEQPIINGSEKNSVNQHLMKHAPQIDSDYLLGKIIPSQSEYMVIIDRQYASREGMFMHNEAYEAFLKMHQAASIEGIELVILSAMRTFDHQKRIWENKWNGQQKLFGDIYATDIDNPVERTKEILRFSAMPGTSRHHWGTDIDLNSLQNNYFETGDGKKVYQWLIKNAPKYGFCQPYTPQGQKRGGGYEEEKWHWSYKPLAKYYLEAFMEEIGYEHITGFDGHETARKLKVIKSYVMDIDPACK